MPIKLSVGFRQFRVAGIFATLVLACSACSLQPATRAGSSATLAASAPPAVVHVAVLSSVDSVLLGVPMAVETVVTPNEDIESLQLRFELSSGLSPEQALPVLSTGPQKAGAHASQTFVFTPKRNGPQFLKMFITTRQGNVDTTRLLTFAMSAGTASPQPVAWYPASHSTGRMALLAATKPGR